MTAPRLRPGIGDIELYVGGRSSVPGRRKIIKLSSNESALGPSPNALKAYRKAAKTLHRYPDGNMVDLREAIGKRHGLDPDRIICGNGSDELLYAVARAYAGPGDEVLYTVHGFNIYPIAAQSVGATPVTAPETNLTADVDALLARVTDKTKVVFVANPNNPTGTYLSADEMRRLRDGLRDDIVLVIDAAYSEFVTRNDYTPGVELVDAGNNVVMTRTFSKIYGLSALRLGWAYCPPDICRALNQLRAPFNVSIAAQMAGIAAVEDTAYTDMARDHNSAWLPWLRDRVAETGLEVVPSVANFILVRFPADGKLNAVEADRFLTGKGIIPRVTASYALPDCLRITIGLESDNRAVAEALSRFMEGR